jgi:hypothetical protein
VQRTAGHHASKEYTISLLTWIHEQLKSYRDHMFSYKATRNPSTRPLRIEFSVVSNTGLGFAAYIIKDHNARSDW